MSSEDLHSSAYRNYLLCQLKVIQCLGFPTYFIRSFTAYSAYLVKEMEKMPGLSQEEKKKIYNPVHDILTFSKTYFKYEQTFLELFITHAVDNYKMYLSEVVYLIFQKCPQILRSDDNISLKEIFKYTDYPELIKHIIENKIDELSRYNLKKLRSYLEERLKLQLFETEDAYQKAQEIIQIRNAIVHNRGIVNKSFLNVVGTEKYHLGKEIEFTVDEVSELIGFLDQVVKAVDTKITNKFGLESFSFSRDLLLNEIECTN